MAQVLSLAERGECNEEGEDFRGVTCLTAKRISALASARIARDMMHLSNGIVAVLTMCGVAGLRPGPGFASAPRRSDDRERGMPWAR